MIVRAVNKQQINRSTLQKINYVLKLFFRAFLTAIFIILLLLFGIILLCYVDTLYNMKKGNIKNPLFGAYVIVTDSMVPTINVNDAIIVKRVDAAGVDVGDIITFSSEDIYYRGLTVTHRVVGKQLGSSGKYIYRTKGDNNHLEDASLVDIDSIYGKVVLKIPKVGYLQKFISSPLGFVISIVIPILLVVVYEVWRIKRMIKQQDSEIEIL